MESVKDTTDVNATVKCWVVLYSDLLYSWALNKTTNKEISEDLVQETFLAAVMSFGKFEGKSEPKTWLIAILKNKTSDYFRKLYRSNEKNAVSFSQFFDNNEDWIVGERPQNWDIEQENHLLDNPDFKKVFKNCLEKLPEQWNASIVLKYIEEKEPKNICQELNISPTNYWQILHRAKLQLRKCLELNWFKK